MSVVVASILAIPLAYFTVRFRFRGAALIQTLGVLPLIMPPFVGAVAMQLLFGRSGSLNLLLQGASRLVFLRIETALRRYIERVRPPPPDPVSAAFELATFADPGLSLAAFAESQGLSLRQLERVVRRDFGLTPKKVLRRARALDLAAQLCGVADDGEADAMMLRYFDQSHLIREFAAFFGVTPREFRSRPRPLLTITLEQRQARRLEELQRIQPGSTAPWRAE